MKTNRSVSPFLGSYYIIVFLLFAYTPVSLSQQLPLKDELLRVTDLSDSLTKKNAPEKLYLQFDKPYYAIADTIWFKAYLLNSAYLTASKKSGVLYLDVANDSNRVVKRFSIAMAEGMGWGNIGIDGHIFASGTYTIHAYTSWMRNMGEDCFFTKTFFVTDTGKSNWLVNRQVNLSTANNEVMANLKLKFNDLVGKPEAGNLLNLQLMAGSKRLYKQAIQTDLSGSLDLNFKIPEKSTNLVLIAENDEKNKKAIIPINLNRPENADVQFMPEGGNLVAGLPAHIGFKAIGEDGKGINVSGIVVDHDQKEVASFQSLHNGMGSFDMTVMEGESYTAKITLPGGAVKEFTLPFVKKSGTVVQIKNPMEADSLQIFMAASKDIAQSGDQYFLIGKARGLVCYAALVSFRNGNVHKKIALRLFPTAITHFTLMTAKGQPLNERLVYIDRQDQLHIRIATDKANYGKRDSIAIKIKVTDSVGDSVEGNFSMAVTADHQVKTDTLNNVNLMSRMLLTADLKGYVETPGYYLSSKKQATWQALDNLLLTQGWIGYDWKQVFEAPKLPFVAEQEMKVSGSVSNVFKRPVKGTNVVLFSKSPAILAEAFTDDDGRFTFNHIPPVDTPIFVLKALNKRGQSFNVRIAMDEVPAPVFTRRPGPVMEPWYVNTDTALANYSKVNKVLTPADYDASNGQLLNEVTISAKKIIKDSQNLNGPGNADVILDEKDLEAAGKKNWLQLLEESVGIRDRFFTAFSHNGTPNFTFQSYIIDDKLVYIIVDGIPLGAVMQPLGFLDLKYYLESHNAEDIKGIEIMTTFRYAMTYASFYSLSMFKFNFVEITTRSGHGPIIDNTPGMYLYKPLAINEPRQFYKPRYAITDTANRVADLRSTIDWEPNIVTNRNGEAGVSFYSADKPDIYTLIIEGTDMNGNLGYKRIKIKADLLEQIPKTGKKNP